MCVYWLPICIYYKYERHCRFQRYYSASLWQRSGASFEVAFPLCTWLAPFTICHLLNRLNNTHIHSGERGWKKEGNVIECLFSFFFFLLLGIKARQRRERQFQYFESFSTIDFHATFVFFSNRSSNVLWRRGKSKIFGG